MDNKKRLAPKAKKVNKVLSIHDDKRIDPYFWMRLSDKQKEAPLSDQDEQTRDVLAYLEAENAYLKEEMEHTEAFQKKLYDEIVGRIKQTDMSVPLKIRGYWYYTRFEEGKEYPVSCRKKEHMEAEEEIMLDGPKMAEGHSYFALGGQAVSQDNQMLAYGLDVLSRRQYKLYFKNLNTGEHYPDCIENTTGSATWANDNQTLFYTRKDPETLRSYRIYKHILGTPAEHDELVYEEKDESFHCYVYKSKSRAYILIGSSSTLSSEYRYLPADKPNGEFKIIQPREAEMEYSVAHFQDDFYIATNWEAKNFRLMKTPVSATSKEHWTEVIGHRDDVLLEGIEIFKDHLVLEERKEGLVQLRIKSWKSPDEHYIAFNDPAYLAYTSSNPEFDTQILRFGYTSLTTPNSTFDYNMKNRERTLLKQQEVMDAQFKVDNYQSERLFATAKDGSRIPISLVYKKGMKKTGDNALLLYGYGSYGSTMDAYFSSVRLSLLDRGFIFAIAHIRGGQEMGRYWYEEGKLLQKMNTFTDFIDCAEYLITNNFSNSGHLYAMGGSAGGLLMGAIINLRPELWKGIIASVPFVDVVSTMLDESIPLTTGEFDEWGNPKEAEYYYYMKSYSPYDNVSAKAYPHMLVTTGYWDSQVQYWEPAKWVAKLRDLKTDDHRLYLYTNLETGHGGASGRFEQFKETALEYAFLLDLENIKS